LNGRFQIAVWRKPKEKLVHILVDTTEKIKKVPIQLEDLPAGFIIHPFADQEDKKAYFLEASELIRIKLDEDEFSSEQLPPWTNPSLAPPEIKSEIRRILRDQSPVSTRDNWFEPTSKAEFLQQVQQGIEAIQSGQLSKIVPVKRKRVAVAE